MKAIPASGTRGGATSRGAVRANVLGAFRDLTKAFLKQREDFRERRTQQLNGTAGKDIEMETLSLTLNGETASHEHTINVPPAWLGLVDQMNYNMARIKNKSELGLISPSDALHAHCLTLLFWGMQSRSWRDYIDSICYLGLMIVMMKSKPLRYSLQKSLRYVVFSMLPMLCGESLTHLVCVNNEWKKTVVSRQPATSSQIGQAFQGHT